MSKWRVLRDDEIIQAGDVTRWKDSTRRFECDKWVSEKVSKICPSTAVVERRVKASKWHDLRADPTDLPDTARNVIVQLLGSDELWADYYSQIDEKAWNAYANVVAWREMPKKYEKEGET